MASGLTCIVSRLPGVTDAVITDGVNGILVDPTDRSGFGSALARVLAPPYDVITPEYRDELYARDPHNVVRLILNRHEPWDDEANNGYIRAGRFLKNWHALQRTTFPSIDGMLVLDDIVGFLGEQDFKEFGLPQRIRTDNGQPASAIPSWVPEPNPAWAGLGWKHPEQALGRENVTPNRPKVEDTPPHVVEAIKRYTAQDADLYATIRARWVDRAAIA